MSSFRTLFQVDIAHDYALSRGATVFEALTLAEQAAIGALWVQSPALRIEPDAPTQATLRSHRMVFRPEGAGGLVAVQIDPTANDLRPILAPAADFTLRFAMRVADPQFANYTELGAAPGWYRFGNDTLNVVAGTRFLSRRVPAFDAARRYRAGDSVASPAGSTFDLFVSVRDTGPSAVRVAADWARIPADTFDATATYTRGAVVLAANNLFRALIDAPGTNLANAADWQPAGVLANQYATAADAVLPVGGLLNLDVAGAALAQATVRVTDRNAQVVVEQAFTSQVGTLDTVQVDLRSVRAGPYRIDVLDAALVPVPGSSRAVQRVPGAAGRDDIGVIEIGLGSGDFALFNADGTLRAPRYVLRFLNRATRWRYIFPAAQAVGTGADVAPEVAGGSVLVTAGPRPLTRFGTGSRLQADSLATPTVSEEILLPAPEPARVRREPAGWYSETHVANLTVGP